VEGTSEGELVIEEVLRRFRDYKMPDVEGALWFDPEWNEPFVTACTRAGLAIGGLCWIGGQRGQPSRQGSARIWAQTKAANWTKYQLFCNAQARNQLQTLAASGAVSFVTFLFIGSGAWRYAQRDFAATAAAMVREDMLASFDGSEITVSARLLPNRWGFMLARDEQGSIAKIVPTTPCSRRCCMVFLVVLAIILICGLLADTCDIINGFASK
jgi:hypothetical protein